MDAGPLPRLHFAPSAGRVDEIYGVVHEDGLYRLLFSSGDGRLGEAVSADLAIWREQPGSAGLGELGCGSVVTGPAVYFTRTPGVIARASRVSGTPGWTTEQVLAALPAQTRA